MISGVPKHVMPDYLRPFMENDTLETLRSLLCALGTHIRDSVLAARSRHASASLSTVAAVTAADTIYTIDKITEDAIIEWFTSHWPHEEPIQIVMEGIDDGEALCFPKGIPVSQTKWKCLLDPIDGTRCLMHDKRSAWALAGLAPQQGDATRLSGILVAAMTELPTTKQWRADQISAVRGQPLRASAADVRSGEQSALALQPSTATDFSHGFSWMAKYFPEGRTLTAQIEERLWEELVGPRSLSTIFDDQYLSTAGAFSELLAGHDRMIGDLRPLVFSRLDLDSPLACHPYDVCTALLLQQAGIIYEHPLGGFPDAPMNTTSAVAWIAYANPTLAATARPVLQKILRSMLA